ncbi:MAG TPA: sulfatase [Blastocatellia bacterium]|nr:sulfatase [Blastocatellia bacterium]
MEENAGPLASPARFAAAGGAAFLFLSLVEIIDINTLSPPVFLTLAERVWFIPYLSVNILAGLAVGAILGSIGFIGSRLYEVIYRILARGRSASIPVRLVSLGAVSALAAFLLNQVPHINRYIIALIREAEKYPSLRVPLLNHERSTSYLTLMGIVIACAAVWLVSRASGRMPRLIRVLWLSALLIAIAVFYYMDSRVELQLYEYTFHRSLYLVNIALAMAFVASVYLSSSRLSSALRTVSKKRLLLAIAAILFIAALAHTFYHFGANHTLKSITFYRTVHTKQNFKLVWYALDLDRDGYSGLLGGGDSDDRRSDINPGRLEVPGDGIDNNSIGGDLTGSQIDEWRTGHTSLHKAPVQPARRFNIIFFFIDTVRADHLSAYGYHRPTSPNLERLPATVFKNAFSPSPRTSEAIPKFMQSNYWDARIESWTQVLERNGYKTMLFPGRRSWERYKTYMPIVKASQGKHLKENIDTAIETLSNISSEDPFCAYIYIPDPHRPYLKHDEFYFGETTIDLYDGELAYTDHHIGRFLDWMESSGRIKDSIVVVMSDHGESLGERGVYRHSTQLYNEQLRVPMILYVPGMTPRRVSDYVSTIDLGSTLLDLVGIEPPQQYIGVSLAPLMRGEPFTRPPVYGEHTQEEYSPYVRLDQQVNPLTKKYMVISQDGFKLIYNRNYYSFELYDLGSDPAEARNLFDLMPERAEEMKRLLGRFVDVVAACRPEDADEGRYSRAGNIDGDKIVD